MRESFSLRSGAWSELGLVVVRLARRAEGARVGADAAGVDVAEVPAHSLRPGRALVQERRRREQQRQRMRYDQAQYGQNPYERQRPRYEHYD